MEAQNKLSGVRPGRSEGKVSRRAFLIAGSASLGALGAPTIWVKASAAATELKILKWSHFVPEYDKWYAEFAAEWGAKNNVRVRVDTLRDEELYPRQATEASSGSGHDIVQFWGAGVQIYSERLVDLTDTAGQLAKDVGEWMPIAQQVGVVNRRWRGLPEFFSIIIGHYRKDLFAQVGENPPDTWEDLLRAGRKLKKLGHPVGPSLFAHNLDDAPCVRTFLLSFGASEVAEDGKTIRINSPQTREALRVAKALFDEAMDPEVLGWDGAANNLFLVSGRGSWISNPISALLAARKNNPEIGKEVGLNIMPRGPAGRFMSTNVLTNGIWTFSKAQDEARQFLRDFYTTQYKNSFVASNGYNYPALKAPFTKPPMPVYDRDPELAAMPEQAKYAVATGYPGPTTPAAEAVFNQWVLNDMFAKVATGTSADEAVKWAEAEVKRIYSQYR